MKLKNKSTQKGSKKEKTIIKRIRVKIKIKNKLERNHKYLIGGLN